MGTPRVAVGLDVTVVDAAPILTQHSPVAPVPVSVDLPPKPGEIVRVRQRRYLVEGVTPPPLAGEQTLVRLSCLEDDAEGEELEVLWEKELDAVRMSGADWSRLAAGHFDDPRYFGAYYHTPLKRSTS